MPIWFGAISAAFGSALTAASAPLSIGATVAKVPFNVLQTYLAWDGITSRWIDDGILDVGFSVFGVHFTLIDFKEGERRNDPGTQEPGEPPEPGQDSIYPFPLFVENDYVRNSTTHLKGIVREVTIIPMPDEYAGQYCLVKYNAGHAHIVENGLGLTYLGHVFNSLR